MIVIEEHIVPDDISNIRLIDYAHKVLNNIPSRSGLKKAIKRGEILIDGSEAEGSNWVKSGQKLMLIDLQNKLPKVFELPLDVVFEDEYLAIVNKPPGISVSGNKFKTIVNALPFNLNNSGQKDALKILRPVHRLDYSTSGLLLVAKTSGSLIALGRQFEQREIEKRYRAIVVGKTPDNGIINEPIDNQEAITEFDLVAHSRSLHTEWLSLLDLYPLTGRTHQIRIHMANYGFPILGDKMYDTCDRVLQGKGLFLSAVELKFSHPILDNNISTSIEMPEKFGKLIASQNRRWKNYN